jgi:hypothetical protein
MIDHMKRLFIALLILTIFLSGCRSINNANIHSKDSSLNNKVKAGISSTSKIHSKKADLQKSKIDDSNIYDVLKTIKPQIQKATNVPVILPTYVPTIETLNFLGSSVRNNKYYAIKYEANKDYYFIAIDTINAIIPINDERLTYVPVGLDPLTFFLLSAGENKFKDEIKYPIIKPNKTFKKVVIDGVEFLTGENFPGQLAYTKYNNWDIYIRGYDNNDMIKEVKSYLSYFRLFKSDIKEGEIFIENNSFQYIKWTSKTGYNYWLYPHACNMDVVKMFNSLF